VLATFKPFTDRASLPPSIQYYSDRAAGIWASSMDALKHLSHIFTPQDYRCSYGFHYASIVACSILAEHTSRSAFSSSTPSRLDPAAYATFNSCLVYLVRLGGFIYTSQVALRVVQDAAEKSRIPLPIETWEHFHAFDGKTWVRQASEHVCSSLPVAGVAAKRGDAGGGQRVDDLMKQWEKGMNLEDT